MDRRKFIHGAGRYILLTGLMALGVFGIYKRKKVPAGECNLTGYCKTCAELSSCSLPQALRQKML